MRIGNIVAKVASGEFLSIHASNRPEEAKQIFNVLRAEARMHRANGETETITVDGKKHELLALWLFINHDQRHVSQQGYETESELKKKAQDAAQREKANMQKLADIEQKKIADAKKAEAEKARQAKEVEEAKNEMIKKQLEKEAVALKQKKAPKAKPATKVKK